MWRRGRQVEARPCELVEIVTPRTNTATITPAENLIAAISMPEPFSLEVAATCNARWFLARTGSVAMRRHLENQVAVAYPQSQLRSLDLEQHPRLDPGRIGADEQVAACTLVLRAPTYLPLRTFHDADVDAMRSSQADPVLGILGALDDLPDGWRGLTQLVLQPAPDDWCRDYLRLAVEHPLASERGAGHADTSLAPVFGLAGLLMVGTLGVQAYRWFRLGDWSHIGLLILGLLVGVPVLVWLARHLRRRPIYDMRLVQEKVSRIAYRAEIRLSVIAPASAPRSEVEERLQRLSAAYRQFNLASGNGLVPRPLPLESNKARTLGLRPATRVPMVLNSRELAGLWHLPQAQADVPLLERTTSRRLLPLPFSVRNGCPIGTSAHQGRSVPVALPEEVLHRHLLLVAKTRRGKSSLLLRIAQHLMQPSTPGHVPSSLVLVDPHRDLAHAVLGLVPRGREDDVVFLDVSERDRPFGLNLLDVGLGWERDKAVSNALAIFRREFGGFWGPRMEDSFRFALLTLYEANEALCREPHGRARQHTILEVPTVLADNVFRRTVLARVADPLIKAWWTGYFDGLDRRLKVEIINPVQTKTQKFAGTHAARGIVGQPRSTIDPLSWLRSGAIVIVNTAKGTVGEDTAALLGGTILNLVALAVGEQAGLAPGQRRPVTLLVDEFHTMPGADYEGILSELAKYGASLLLATQSLARLEALDREQNRTLRSMVFANLDGLFAFHTSAEDARYLVPELGDEIDEQDLVGLGEHRCYVKLSAGGERLPTFSVHLDPPPRSVSPLAGELAAQSVARYGRDRALVEADLRSSLARIESTHGSWGEENLAEKSGKRGVTDGSTGNRKEGRRNEHRNSQHVEVQQPLLPQMGANGSERDNVDPSLGSSSAQLAGEAGTA
jgi:hypothetical protein